MLTKLTLLIPPVTLRYHVLFKAVFVYFIRGWRSAICLFLQVWLSFKNSTKHTSTAILSFSRSLHFLFFHSSSDLRLFNIYQLALLATMLSIFAPVSFTMLMIKEMREIRLTRSLSLSSLLPNSLSSSFITSVLLSVPCAFLRWLISLHTTCSFATTPILFFSIVVSFARTPIIVCSFLVSKSFSDTFLPDFYQRCTPSTDALKRWSRLFSFSFFSFISVQTGGLVHHSMVFEYVTLYSALRITAKCIFQHELCRNLNDFFICRCHLFHLDIFVR